MPVEHQARPPRSKRTRDRQRRLHMATGILLIANVYLPVSYGSAFDLAIRWLLLPALVLSGVLMWQWPRVRRLGRQLAARS